MTSEAGNREALISTGKKAMEDLQRLHDHPDSFQPSKFSDSEVKVFVRKSDDPSCPEDIIKAVVLLEGVSIDQVLALALPWFSYRTKWDDLLLEAKTIETFSPSMKVIQHVTKKKMPLSARDSVDVVTVASRGSTIFMSSRSTAHSGAPESKDRVRTFQHLGGYAFRPTDGGSVEFEMYFHADLRIGGISLVKSIVESVKPKFMSDLLKNLRKEIRRIAVTTSDLETMRSYIEEIKV